MIERMAGELGEILDDIAAGQSDISQFNTRICEWFPGINITAAVLDKANLSPVIFESTGMPPEDIAAYLEYYWQVNPWANFWTTAKSGVSYKSSRQFSSARFSDSEFFNDFLLKLNTTEAVAIRLENLENEIVTITAMVPAQYLDREEDSLARLFDAVSHKLVDTVRSIRHIAEVKGQSIAAGAVLARSPDLAIVLDASLRPVAMNEDAEQSMGPQSLFDIVSLRFFLRNPDAQKWLTKAVSQMIRLGTTSSDQMFTRDRSRYYRLNLSLVAEHDPREGIHRLSQKSLVLLQIRDLSPSSAGLEKILEAPVFRLTRAEARMCVSLAQGLTTTETAAFHGISVDAVRYHLKSIFAKFEVSRQSELTAILQRLT